MTKELTTQENNKALTPVDNLKNLLDAESVQKQFKNALADNAPLFVASLIDIYASDTTLQGCAPSLVIMEALKAATLKLPINKSLGFAWIIPYKKNKKIQGKWVKVPTPQFQMGYKGWVQLAMRTGEYKYINAGKVYEGELVGVEKLSGLIDLSGERTSDKVVGYFAFFQTLNGFQKMVYGTEAEVVEHAQKHSAASFKDPKSAWKTDFHAMATKTMLTQLLGKWGMMSVEMVSALSKDQRSDEDRLAGDINANDPNIIDIEDEGPETAGESVPCPKDADGDTRLVSYCNSSCPDREGCKAWAEEDFGGGPEGPPMDDEEPPIPEEPSF